MRESAERLELARVEDVVYSAIEHCLRKSYSEEDVIDGLRNVVRPWHFSHQLSGLDKRMAWFLLLGRTMSLAATVSRWRRRFAYSERLLFSLSLASMGFSYDVLS